MFAETSIELLLPEVSYSVLFVTEYYLFIERSFLKSVLITKQFVIGNFVEYAIYQNNQHAKYSATMAIFMN